MSRVLVAVFLVGSLLFSNPLVAAALTPTPAPNYGAAEESNPNWRWLLGALVAGGTIIDTPADTLKMEIGPAGLHFNQRSTWSDAEKTCWNELDMGLLNATGATFSMANDCYPIITQVYSDLIYGQWFDDGAFMSIINPPANAGFDFSLPPPTQTWIYIGTYYGKWYEKADLQGICKYIDGNYCASTDIVAYGYNGVPANNNLVKGYSPKFLTIFDQGAVSDYEAVRYYNFVLAAASDRKVSVPKSFDMITGSVRPNWDIVFGTVFPSFKILEYGPFEVPEDYNLAAPASYTEIFNTRQGDVITYNVSWVFHEAYVPETPTVAPTYTPRPTSTPYWGTPRPMGTVTPFPPAVLTALSVGGATPIVNPTPAPSGNPLGDAGNWTMWAFLEWLYKAIVPTKPVGTHLSEALTTMSDRFPLSAVTSLQGCTDGVFSGGSDSLSIVVPGIMGWPDIPIPIVPGSWAAPLRSLSMIIAYSFLVIYLISIGRRFLGLGGGGGGE